MSFGNFLYQVEGIGALPDASLYTDKYWCVLTGNSQYQCATYKSDGTNWIYVDGCVTYGPGTPYPDIASLPVGPIVFYDGKIWKSDGDVLYDFNEQNYLAIGDVLLSANGQPLIVG